MRKMSRFGLTAVFFGLLALIVLCASPDLCLAGNAAKMQAVGVPSLQMKHWKQSTHQEKMAFVFGFATFLEMEKEWQGGKRLPLSQSTVGSWVRGLDGVTLGQIVRTLDKYVKDNPQNMEDSVLEVLGATYVRPKLTQDERKRAAKKVEELKQ